MKKNKFKKLAGLLLAAVMALAALPIQTLASEWGKGDSVYAAMLGDYVEVGCNSVLNPGTVIGSHSNIYPLSRVRGYVSSNSIYKDRNDIVTKH